MFSVWLYCLSAHGAGGHHLYVCPEHGDDTHDGKAPTHINGNTGPQRTLEAAQETVRKWIKAGLNEDVYVELRGGRFELSGPLVFTPEDGHDRYNVTWRNYDEEPVRISGGRRITAKWSWDEEKGCYRAHPPEVASGAWWFRDVYLDDERLTRSRWPKAPTDTMKMAWTPDARRPADEKLLTVAAVNEEKTSFTMDQAPEIPVQSHERVELVAFWHWTAQRAMVERTSDATVHLAGPMDGFLDIQPDVNDRTYFENSYAFVDKPNEWALDANGNLYAGSDPSDRTLIAPYLDNVITVEGESTVNRVSNLHFDGLIIEHAHFDLPNNDARNEHARQAGIDRYDQHPSAAVRFTYTRRCSIRNSTIARSTGVGVHLDIGSYRDTIARCDVYDIGNSGIIIGNTGEKETTPVRTAYAMVENNRIFRCGQLTYGSVGIGEIFMYGSTIQHNELFDLPYTGISAGWTWWMVEPTNSRRHTIRFNHVHHVMQFMEDGGGIYTLGDQTETEIAHNLIQNVGWQGQQASGIYADEGTSYAKFAGNVIDTVRDGWCLFMHRDNYDLEFQNNIFIDGQRGEIRRNHWPPEEFDGVFMHFHRNILYPKTKIDSFVTDIDGNWSFPSQFTANHNAYYHDRDDKTKTFAGYTWEEWRDMGHDTQSHYHQDPMFEDAWHRDQNYRLKGESPLLKAPMQFEQVRVDEAGVRPVAAPRDCGIAIGALCVHPWPCRLRVITDSP